jgi:thioredoxin 1
MKLTRTFTALAMLVAANAAFALDIQPYSDAAFASLQKTNQPVTVHFYADWCPTCHAQAKIFQQWKGDATVPGTLLVANFDTEKDLKKQYNVRAQSTVIVFKGGVEKARLGGVTQAAQLRAAMTGAE